MIQTWMTYFPIAGLIGLAVAMVIFLTLKRLPAGTEVMRGISDQIQLGAMTYLKRQYLTLFFFVTIVACPSGLFLDVEHLVCLCFRGTLLSLGRISGDESGHQRQRQNDTGCQGRRTGQGSAHRL